jgi:hypothetical protein
LKPEELQNAFNISVVGAVVASQEVSTSEKEFSFQLNAS